MAGKSAMRGKTEAVPRSTKATKRLSVDELVAFMSLPIFYELRTAVDVGILLFDDLDEYDLPEGYSKEDIWRILLAVRKQAAVFVPEDPERPHRRARQRRLGHGGLSAPFGRHDRATLRGGSGHDGRRGNALPAGAGPHRS